MVPVPYRGQAGVVWCGRCGVVWYGVVWCVVVWCGVVWCGVVWCGVVWCGVVWCGVVWRGSKGKYGKRSRGTGAYPCHDMCRGTPNDPPPSPPLSVMVAQPAQVTQMTQVPLTLVHEPLRTVQRHSPSGGPMTRHNPNPPPPPLSVAGSAPLSHFSHFRFACSASAFQHVVCLAHLL